MRRWIEQAVGIELPLDFHQGISQAAQRRDAYGLVVDESPAAAIGTDHPAQMQSFRCHIFGDETELFQQY